LDILKTTGLVAVIAAFVVAPAAAKIVTVDLNADFATSPYSYAFGGTNSVTFSGNGSNPMVETHGGLQVTSLAAPFYPAPTPSVFFNNRGGNIGPTTLIQFASFASPTSIPYASTPSVLGLRFDLGKGLLYGYADFAGTMLHGFRYETTPGVGVNISAVPEPAAWTLMITGFGVAGTALRRRRAVAA